MNMFSVISIFSFGLAEEQTNPGAELLLPIFQTPVLLLFSFLNFVGAGMVMSSTRLTCLWSAILLVIMCSSYSRKESPMQEGADLHLCGGDSNCEISASLSVDIVEDDFCPNLFGNFKEEADFSFD